MKVDKIGPEHIGRWVKKESWILGWLQVKAIDEDEVWLKSDSGCGTYESKNSWIIKDLPEKKKLPSERITKILQLNGISNPGIMKISPLERAVLNFLDEDAEGKE